MNALFCSFLSQTQTERVPFKLPKVENVTKPNNGGVRANLWCDGKFVHMLWFWIDFSRFTKC